ncbi:MAG: gamma-glutamyl-gamma-aminobutyrate hydrolase family protein [Deltaproteobacteria bacterium]|nr:gamma-glutamyl-gamma-aminobutyrate hydrolase family protein [Nannocystaceae bacterium]
MRMRLGISANFFHADSERAVFRHKTLQYLEQRMAQAVWRAGGLPVLVPELDDAEAAAAFVDELDGLVLAGGADVSPTSYGEIPLRDTWSGDALRDAYEQRLVELAIARGIPVLGICRGIQLLNVALGGSLWQDIGTQVEGALVHRDWHNYDENGHAVRLEPGSWIAGIYGDAALDVNSVHHQAIKVLAPGLRATAWAPDGTIEAVQDVGGDRFLVAVQWHPEWLDANSGVAGRARGEAVFVEFVRECSRRATTRVRPG